jgi:hypothetical protein
MTQLVLTPRLRRSIFGSFVTLLAITLLVGLAPVVFAQAPKPDPPGIATGDRNNAIDGAGNSFVVSEPTDKSAPDYAEKKKAFDDYQAQAAPSFSFLDGWVLTLGRRSAPRTFAFPWSPSTPTSQPFLDQPRQCFSGGSSLANRTSQWPATECSRGLWQ